MATILPRGQRIEHIELITNWFESHRVLGPILTAAAEFAAASKCTYIDPSASIIVVGPKDLANRYAVDELTIQRARQREFIQRIKLAAQAISIDDPGDFDRKMAVLRKIRPDQVDAIASLADELRANWRMALAFERELNETLPGLHRDLEDDRRRILTRIIELMLATSQPWTELGHAQELAKGILDQHFDKPYGPLVTDVSSGEVARLIGECPIGWEEPGVRHA